MIEPAQLLAGPRGRGLCLAVAAQFSQAVAHARFQLAFAGHEQGSAELVRGLRTFVPDAVHGWGDALFREPMAQTVGQAMYWQAPHADDAVTADPALISGLEPVATAIASTPGAAWWTDPMDLQQLRLTTFAENEQASPLAPGVADRLRRWREGAVAGEAAAAQHTDPDIDYSGSWWSTPVHANLPVTTRPFPSDGGPVALSWQEDWMGWAQASVTPVAVRGQASVWELDGPDSWVQLVRRYPLEVTHSRRHDWRRVTGRAGRWLIPDWSAVAIDFDAVHLTVAGYLAAATRSLTLDGEFATMLAGWSPDETYWLTDVLDASGPARPWRKETTQFGDELWKAARTA